MSEKRIIKIDLNDHNLLEALGEIEHIQWIHWTKYMLANLTPENIERWKRQVETVYPDLSEKEKESDREWARKVLAAINKWWWGEY